MGGWWVAWVDARRAAPGAGYRRDHRHVRICYHVLASDVAELPNVAFQLVQLRGYELYSPFSPASWRVRTTAVLLRTKLAQVPLGSHVVVISKRAYSYSAMFYA